MFYVKEKDLTAEELEQEQKDNTRYKELVSKAKEERTEEELGELDELKERHSSRTQKRIDKLTWQRKQAEEEAERLRFENEELRSTKEKKEDITPAPIHAPFEEIGGKKYLSDEALVAKMKSGELTENQAIKYKDDKLVARAVEKMKEEDKQQADTRLRLADITEVYQRHPDWARKKPDGTLNPDFNGDDPLYKLTDELWKESYKYLPDGLSKAEKRAAQMLKINNTSVDRSEDLGFEESRPSDRTVKKEDKVTLSEVEKEAAVRFYTLGDAPLKANGRNYTREEALHKALEAKKARLRKE